MLSKAPFVGVVLLFMSGILLGGAACITHAAPLLFPLLLLVASSACLFYYFKLNHWLTASLWLFLIIAGAFSRNRIEAARDRAAAFFEDTSYSAYQAKIAGLPEKRGKNLRFEADVHSVLHAGRWMPQQAKALISLPAAADEVPRPGDIIVVKGQLELPMASANPEQFDYREYLRNKGILLVDRIREGNFEVYQVNPNRWHLAHWLTATSGWADQLFRENIRDNRSYGLVKAMLLGRRDDLDPAQTDDYVASGTVHILSVSGMHVAIIFILISTALGWLKKWRAGKLLYVLIILFSLVFYALVTGFSPSVQRATVMCVVFVLAEVAGRKQVSMNTLAISAFLILLFDPLALFDVGFQLSYLAMAGIFLFYEPIYALFNPKYRVLQFVWQISALAFAAQLTTFPLSVYYFHQFPTYFWLVNPFVVAFTNVLLPAALLLLLVSLVELSWLQWIVNQVVDWAAYLTNVSAGVPKLLPGYLIGDIHLALPEVILLYLLFFMIWLVFEKREYKFLKYAFGVAAIYMLAGVSGSTQAYFSHGQVTHAIPGHSVVSYKSGNVLYLFSDAGFEGDEEAFKFYIKDYAIAQEIGKTVFIPVLAK